MSSNTIFTRNAIRSSYDQHNANVLSLFSKQQEVPVLIKLAERTHTLVLKPNTRYEANPHTEKRSLAPRISFVGKDPLASLTQTMRAVDPRNITEQHINNFACVIENRKMQNARENAPHYYMTTCDKIAACFYRLIGYSQKEIQKKTGTSDEVLYDAEAALEEMRSQLLVRQALREKCTPTTQEINDNNIVVEASQQIPVLGVTHLNLVQTQQYNPDWTTPLQVITYDARHLRGPQHQLVSLRGDYPRTVPRTVKGISRYNTIAFPHIRNDQSLGNPYVLDRRHSYAIFYSGPQYLVQPTTVHIILNR
jgi:hypothetical protein